MLSNEFNRNKPITQPAVSNGKQAAPACQPAVATIRPGQGFYGLGIAPKILEVLERIKFKTPTPIQSKVIPHAINGADIVGIAQTGTGKTHAFAIPMIQHIAQKPGNGLVLAPTRELAMQIDEAFRPIAQAFGIKTTYLVGGVPIYDQTRALRGNPRVIIATPGRLMDHMERRNVRLDNVVMLVLDEADRMLDMGFSQQVEKILSFIPKKRQTMLFSATMAREIMDVTNRHMKLPLSIEIAPSGTTAELVTQELFIVKPEAKLKLLNKMLARYPGSVLLFVRMKHQAGKIAKAIRLMGYSASEIHSNRTQAQRKEALDGFKSGRHKVLVATDVAARGIDVRGIELVINFDLPDDTEYYVHRIGRTGRAGHTGHAISFATPDQSRDVADIEKLIRTPLPISRHPEIPQEQFVRTVVWAARRPGRFRGRRR
ncbi:MAG TPA: DEAD/DEAH box helicase [Planctomycetota bacterium]|nr:DEAD/DEAH box helicase [Planctomycetota bacterium]